MKKMHKKKERALPKFAIIGQPNVGKSSLLNALIGEERTIVSDVAGTTRDTIHTHYKLYQKEFILNRYRRRSQKDKGDGRPGILFRNTRHKSHG